MDLVTQSLFYGGAALVAAPIIIHLLNKRQFKVLDWAAMDFLLEANKSNRRRVRLEDLLLLLLRCAAVLLIALLVARPIQSLSGAGGLLDSVRYSRIVVLDDSYSMTARSGGQSAFDDAKQSLVDLVQQWAIHHSDDAFSLVVLSEPDKPMITAEALSEDNIGDVIEKIKKLDASSTTARMPRGFDAIRRSLDGSSVNANQLCYVFTDLRRRDWSLLDSAEPVHNDLGHDTDDRVASQTAVSALRRLADDVAGCYLVDVDTGNTANLTIRSVAPRDRVLVAGVPAVFDVEVANRGTRTSSEIEVVFHAGGSLAVSEVIGSIEPGATAVVQFPCNFGEPADEMFVTAPVPVEVQLQVAAGDVEDCVEADSRRYFAARPAVGIQTLIVDGDLSPVARRSESHFLRQALNPPGPTRGGAAVTVVGPSDFETVILDDYQVVFLCNLESIGAPRRETLEKWCQDGGGLVLAPGDQLFDPGEFNRELFRDGKGLSPIRLADLAGVEDRSSWVHFKVMHSNHDLLKLYADQNSPLLELVKIFRWWHAELPEASDASTPVAVLARFTNPEKSPAIVEHRFGKGRVVAMTTPLDADWSDWPKSPGGGVYVAMMQDLIRYVARSTSIAGDLLIDTPLIQSIHLAQFRPNVTLTRPNGDRQALQALPSGDQQDARPTRRSLADQDAIWRVIDEEIGEPGFYRLELITVDEQLREVLFAASVDTSEGDLVRVDRSVLDAQLEGSKVQVLDRDQLMQATAATVRSELWPLVLMLLVFVLCGELLLGWYIGNRRLLVATRTGSQT